MSDRVYFFLVGLGILAGLYIESMVMIYMLNAVLVMEGLTGITIARWFQKARGIELGADLLASNKGTRFNFEALRAMRLVIAIVVLISYILVHEYNIEALWFFPWFLGFAVLGAGISGICPVYLTFKWLGFK
ncbi:MAG: hypothetical protein OQK69_01225 [Gammaproteobacteria bacterium]|nr:hypothetical protein [Gammaproteobacteria bacterium]